MKCYPYYKLNSHAHECFWTCYILFCWLVLFIPVPELHCWITGVLQKVLISISAKSPFFFIDMFLTFYEFFSWWTLFKEICVSDSCGIICSSWKQWCQFVSPWPESLEYPSLGWWAYSLDSFISFQPTYLEKYIFFLFWSHRVSSF